MFMFNSLCVPAKASFYKVSSIGRTNKSYSTPWISLCFFFPFDCKYVDNVDKTNADLVDMYHFAEVQKTIRFCRSA